MKATMNLDFDDPNCLIDDSTPVPSKTLDWATALQGARIIDLEFGEDIQKVLKPPHFEAIKFSNSSIRDDENGIIIETYVREYFSCPKEVREAFAQVNQVMQQCVRYKKIAGGDRLWWKEEISNHNHHRHEEVGKYITAAKYLPDLLRENGDILVKPEQHKRFAEFKRQYKTQALWIEYYLLENSLVLTELGVKPPTKRQYKPGKISAMLHELIQEVWALAINKNLLCRWILSFDCPSQVWLVLEAIFIIRQWNRGKPLKNGFQLYKSEQLILNRLREPKGIKATLLYSDNENENFLSLDEAFSFTLSRLLESDVVLDRLEDYLDAITGQVNLVRKGETGKRSNRGFGTSR
jgi:hypothetical protein